MHVLLLPIRVVRRFFVERMVQTAAALSFTTLLGLVPMIAVAAAVLAHFPLAETLSTAIQKFLMANLLPEKAGKLIGRYVARFANQADRMTWISVASLGLTALAQMFTIERAFDTIWRVRASRPLLRRLTMHLMALLLGPAIFGGSLAATTYIASASLGLIDEWRSLTASVLRALSFVTVGGVFALIYWKLPNRPVAGLHAMLGGTFAAVGFTAMQWLFAAYIANVPEYRVIYGAFATIPIFMLWLFLSWSVILFGALIAADLGAGRKGAAGATRAS